MFALIILTLYRNKKSCFKVVKEYGHQVTTLIQSIMGKYGRHFSWLNNYREWIFWTSLIFSFHCFKLWQAQGRGEKSQNERKAIKNWMSTKICVIVGITFHWTGIKLWSTQKGNRYKHRILQHPTHSISQLCNKKLSGTFLSNSKLSCLIQSYWWKDLLNEK